MTGLDPDLTMTLPSFADIKDDFSLLDEWEDRYRYVIELGRRLPPLAASERTEANKVRGCASHVWLIRVPGDADEGPDAKLVFAGESDAHIVQGLIAILLSIANGKTAREIAATDIAGQFDQLGLKEHLTPQRSNGLASMVSRIKSEAQSILAA